MIRPHLGTLVPALLEAVAGLEHKALSYTAVRTTTDEDRDRWGRRHKSLLEMSVDESLQIIDVFNISIN